MRDPGTEPDASPARMDLAPASELEDAPARRGTPAARLVRVGLAALACLVAGGVLLHELASVPPRPGSAPAPLGPAVLLSNVSFGTVTINGTALGGPPPLALPLRDGRNTITVSARPFAPRTCHVTWGAQGWVAGDCPAIGTDLAQGIAVHGLAVHPSAVIVARFTGQDLPQADYDAARAMVVRQLRAVRSYSRDVPPDEPIATGGYWPLAIESHPAGASVRADMSFDLYADASNDPHRQLCDVSLCAGAFFYTTAAASLAPLWNVAPDAYYVWRFHSRSGDEASPTYPVSPAISLPLTYDVADGWQPLTARMANGFPVPTDVLLDGTFCNAAIYLLNAATQSLGDIATVVGNSGATGCVLDLKTQKLAHEGLFLWRFGVLLAADGPAHQFLPDLPVASPMEIAEASGA